MITTISVVFKICLKEIWKEEDFQHNEQDKKLDQDNQPDLFSPSGKI